MKKKNILNLIKYHVEKNDSAFRNESISIARYFDSIGDQDLAEYILGLLSELPQFSPQNVEVNSEFLEQLDTTNLEPLHLPLEIMNDIGSILFAVKRNMGINKFLFIGEPGTGKTEAAKQIARLLKRNLYRVDLESLIDSNVEITNTNIISAFEQLYCIPDTNTNSNTNPNQTVILFDEINTLIFDRVNSNDTTVNERLLSTLLDEVDKLSSFYKDIVLIATTNYNNEIDNFFIQRFNFIVNFNRYSEEDLKEICEFYCDSFIKDFKGNRKAIRLLRKILNLANTLPYPGELKNIVKASIVFSDISSEFDYLKRLYNELIGKLDLKDILDLYKEGFSIREIEIMKGVSKSTVSRKLHDKIINSHSEI